MFERVVIVGVGLLGASLGLALKERRLARHVVGVGRKGSASIAVALERGAIDAAADGIGPAAAGADVIVLCTPVGQFPEALRVLRGALAPGAVVTDVGSTKRQVMAWAADLLGADGAAFVGSHPMAGSEKRGPEHARADLFEGALCLVCAGERQSVEAPQRIEALWRGVGMRTLPVDAATHDRWVAQVSHMPHAIAFALMQAAAKDPETLAAAAGGFGDMTRIAGSDPEMWTDIFMTNADAVTAAIDGFSRELAGIRAAIAAGDPKPLRELLVRSRAERESFMTRHGGRGGGGPERRKA